MMLEKELTHPHDSEGEMLSWMQLLSTTYRVGGIKTAQFRLLSFQTTMPVSISYRDGSRAQTILYSLYRTCTQGK